MAQARRDENVVTSLLGVSNVDGSTPVVVYADPVTHRLLVDGCGAGDQAFDASVGTACGGTYATVKAAVDDNKKRILVLCDTTETANIDPPLATTDLLINIVPTATWNLATFIVTNTNPLDLTLQGGGTLTYAYTVTNTRPFSLFDTDTLKINDLIIDNNSTVDNTPLSFGLEHISNVRFLLPNQGRGGITTNGDIADLFASSYHDIEFVGGGTSCTSAFLSADSEAGANITNISFLGTFKPATSPPTGNFNTEYVAVFRGVNITNIFFDYIGSSSFYFETSNVNNLFYGDQSLITGVLLDLSFSNALSNFNGNDGITVSFFLDGFNQINNVSLRGTAIFDLDNSDQNLLSNILVGTGFIDMTDASCSENQLINCRMSAASSIGGDNNKFTNCEFVGGATVVSGANDNGFSNCQFGADAGSGVLTITVDAGSNRTRIVGCMTDAAISDAGTGTTTAGNAVY